MSAHAAHLSFLFSSWFWLQAHAAAAGGAPSLEVLLARAQAAALSGDTASTSAALAALPDAVLHAPRVVATRVALCAQGKDPQALLDESVSFWERQGKDLAGSRDFGDAVGRAAAEQRLRSGQPGDASALFERLAKSAASPEAREEARAPCAVARMHDACHECCPLDPMCSCDASH